jgi:hypothetical protein
MTNFQQKYINMYAHSDSGLCLIFKDSDTVIYPVLITSGMNALI